MHPILFHIGDFPIGTYGVIFAIAALAAIWLARLLARQRDLDPEQITDLGVYTLLAAFVGAKLAMIIGDFREFSDHPLEYIVGNLRSFGAFYGGFMVAVYVAVLYVRKKGLPLWRTADVTAPALALGQTIGRWGCFFAGCCYGKPTDAPWGLIFPEVPLCFDDTPIHPWPLYESLGDGIIFVILLILLKRRFFDGMVFLTYVALYALLRGFLEFYRGDDLRGVFFDGAVSFSQILAAIALPSAMGLLIWRSRAARSGKE